MHAYKLTVCIIELSLSRFNVFETIFVETMICMYIQSFENMIRANERRFFYHLLLCSANNLDPDEAGHKVRSDLDTNCLTH